MSPEKFHWFCDGKGDTLVLIKENEGHVFGGFTRKAWSTSGDEISDVKAFIFSISEQIIIDPIDNLVAVYHSKKYGPCFGTTDILISGKNFDFCQSKLHAYKNPKIEHLSKTQKFAV